MPPAKRWRSQAMRKSGAFHLPVFEIDRSVAAENGDGNPEFAALGVDLFDDAALVLKWAVGHFHGLADGER